MSDNNDISAQENIANLDLIGQTLIRYAKSNKPIDPNTALMISVLVAQCRNYSTVRDQDTLTDETSRFVLDHISKTEQSKQEKEENSITDAADEIINDLRKSGISI